MKKFFLMTRGRTGSTAVIDELNNCTGFRIAQELFLRFKFNISDHKKMEGSIDYIPPFLVWKEIYHGLKRRPSILANQYLKETEEAASKQGAEIFGFKLLSHNFDEFAYLCKLLKKRGYKSIYLTRNLSLQVISGMVANQRKMYNTKKEFEDQIRYTIDLDKFKKLVKWEGVSVRKDKELLRARGIEFIEISYDDFLQDREYFYQTIFEFLNAKEELPAPSDYMIMIKNLKYTIENYEELVECSAEIGIPIGE